MSARAYSVVASGGGSSYRFDGPDPERPPLPLVSLREAREQADWWNGHADTIGGDALVVHIPTGRCFTPQGCPRGALREALAPRSP